MSKIIPRVLIIIFGGMGILGGIGGLLVGAWHLLPFIPLNIFLIYYVFDFTKD